MLVYRVIKMEHWRETCKITLFYDFHVQGIPIGDLFSSIFYTCLYTVYLM